MSARKNNSRSSVPLTIIPPNPINPPSPRGK
uniref:Uncharacterized protein n=1 Tax=Rhizophora mucronata TaxID=61149 RepID=A0A2P2QPM8_RHIMU